MKKNIDSQLELYPMPVTVTDAMKKDNPAWTLVAHMGIISLAASHFINSAIKAAKKLSINIVDEASLPQADYAGSVSGEKECTVVDIYIYPEFEGYIYTIDATYVEEEY